MRRLARDYGHHGKRGETRLLIGILRCAGHHKLEVSASRLVPALLLSFAEKSHRRLKIPIHPRSKPSIASDVVRNGMHGMLPGTCPRQENCRQRVGVQSGLHRPGRREGRQGYHYLQQRGEETIIRGPGMKKRHVPLHHHASQCGWHGFTCASSVPSSFGESTKEECPRHDHSDQANREMAMRDSHRSKERTGSPYCCLQVATR